MNLRDERTQLSQASAHKIPATFVIDRDLRVELAHFDVDYRRGVESDDALAAVRKMSVKNH